MFVWSAATRIYLALGATALRQGFDGPYALVHQRLALDPLSGHLFVFANRRRSRIKLLFWDGSGLWLCSKRLERGRFRWPVVAEGESKLRLSAEELAALLGGLDFNARRAGLPSLLCAPRGDRLRDQRAVGCGGGAVECRGSGAGAGGGAD